MLFKIYWTLWILIGLAAFALFLVGSFTMLAGVAFGFVAFGMTFMGMMGVLPVLVSHPAIAQAAPVKKVSVEPAKETRAGAFNVLKSA